MPKLSARLLAAVALFCVSLSSANADQRYRVVEIGMVGTDGSSFAAAINSIGQVTGTSYAGTSMADVYGYHAFLYTPSKGLTALSPLPGDAWSTGQAINDKGQVVGMSLTSYSSPQWKATIYSPGFPPEQIPNTVGGTWTIARSINNSGQVVGIQDSDTGVRYGFVYENPGSIRTYGGPSGNPAVEFNDINNKGEIVGFSYTPFVFSEATGYTILSPNGIPWAINDAGTIVGNYFTPFNPMAAFFLRSGGVELLGSLGGPSWPTAWSVAYDINNHGDVIGTAGIIGGSTGFIFSSGKMVSLNDLLDPASIGFQVIDARGINDSGWIAANGISPTGRQEALLLVPVPEPETYALFLSGLGLVGAIGRNRKSH